MIHMVQNKNNLELEIILVLLKNKSHLREIARTLNESHSTIFEDIKKNFPKGMIILFGSYAKGTPKKDSDIDIYLETNDNNIKAKVKEINSRLSIKIGKFDTKSLLIKEIIKNHIIIRGLEDFYERVEFFKEA